MKKPVTVLLAVGLLAALAPMQQSIRAEAANTTCQPTATGEPISPGVNFGLGEIFATEDIQGTAVCASATGDVFTVTVTVSAEYFNSATLTWQATSCTPVTVSGNSSTLLGPGTASSAFAITSTGCNYLVGDPSLNALHRAHTHVTTSLPGTGPFDFTSDPYLLPSVG